MNTRITINIPAKDLLPLVADYIASRIRVKPEPEAVDLKVLVTALNNPYATEFTAIQAQFDLPPDHDPDLSSNPHPQAD